MALRTVLSRRPVVTVSNHARAMSAAPKAELYSERQAKLGRPVSPHVTIYAFPVVALSSITVRLVEGVRARSTSYQ